MKSNFEEKRCAVIGADVAADEWLKGYPLGNGRIGAMVTGKITNERISLNHDLLWRRYVTWQDRKCGSLLSEVQSLCMQGLWDEAQEKFLSKIPETGHAVYINPFVPFCDLGLFMNHGDGKSANYRRELDMHSGMVNIRYEVDGKRFLRECFCPYGSGMFIMRITCSHAASITGEVSLSRLAEDCCDITAEALPGSLSIKGEFEEGGTFAAKVKVIQRGGIVSRGIRNYAPPAVENSPFGCTPLFRDETQEFTPCGVSTLFVHSDEVIIAIALSTDDESDKSPEELCFKKINDFEARYPDIEELISSHKADHSSLFDRAGIYISGGSDNEDMGTLINHVEEGRAIDNSLYGRLYSMGRYLAIASGRPQPESHAPKAPINLQGIWNQDPHPAWDSDYHLDLNLEMCYWGLDAMNLGELMEPLMDWVTRLMPQARHAAMDIYGCRGVCLNAVCDNKTIGTTDSIGYCFTSAAAWVAQILWDHYECTLDKAFLRDKLYPFLKELGTFYDDFLIENDKGRLITCPSCSPEMGIGGRKNFSVLSSMSAIDMELIREVYANLLTASDILGTDSKMKKEWSKRLEKLPLPEILPGRGLSEWLEPHEPLDQGHRHRSHLVGILPGDRITMEDTPAEALGVKKALEYRLEKGTGSSLSFSASSDAATYARLYEAKEAINQLDAAFKYHVTENLLVTLFDWRDRGETLSWFGGHKLFQIEAELGLTAAIGDMIVHDRRGVIRLLPALPSRWEDGQAFGIRAKNGFEVSVAWEKGNLKQAEVKSELGKACRIIVFSCEGELEITCGRQKVDYQKKDGIMTFDTKKNTIYRISPVEKKQ